MTPEEKQLLLKDLCARLPYGFIIHRYSDNRNITFNSNEIDDFAHFLEYSDGKEFKPYLRPVSSITEEERREFEEMFDFPFEAAYDTVTKETIVYDSIVIDKGYEVEIGIDTIALMLDWLLARHFDCRSLIPKGLALEAPEGMYKTE